jgi:hypothetical protein
MQRNLHEQFLAKGTAPTHVLSPCARHVQQLEVEVLTQPDDGEV